MEEEKKDQAEEKAREMGWVPEEEWKGDPEKWRPAEEFVSRGENIIPIMRKEIKTLKEELKVISELNKKELEKVKQQGYEQAKAEFDKKKRELDQKELEAFQEGDAETYQKIKSERESLKPPEEPKEEEKPQETPVFQEWKTKNDWYESDEDLTLFAQAVAAQLAPQGLPEAEFYKAVEEKVKKTFPTKFENPRRNQPSMADSGHEAGGSKKKTWGDLPPEAKQAYSRIKARLEKAGREYKKEEYVKQYFEED